MKTVFTLFLTLAVAWSASAQSNNVPVGFKSAQIEKVSQVSEELATLKLSLEKVQSQRTSAIVQVIVSAVALGVLLPYGIKTYNTPGGDMAGPINMGLGLVIEGVAGGAGLYGAAQAYRVTIKNTKITELISAISAKQLELEAAKRVLEQLN